MPVHTLLMTTSDSAHARACSHVVEVGEGLGGCLEHSSSCVGRAGCIAAACLCWLLLPWPPLLLLPRTYTCVQSFPLLLLLLLCTCTCAESYPPAAAAAAAAATYMCVC